MSFKHNLKKFVKGDEYRLVDGLYLDCIGAFPKTVSIGIFCKKKINEGTEGEVSVIIDDSGDICSLEYAWDKSMVKLPYGDFRGGCWYELVYEEYEERIVPVSKIFQRHSALYLLAEYVPDEDVI